MYQVSQVRRPDSGSMLAMRLELDAARFELARQRTNFYRLLFVAAAGWLLFTAVVFVFSVHVSSSRLTRDSMGADHGAPPPIFRRVL
jgi:hypothetical protein